MIKINLLPQQQIKRVKLMILYQNVISSGLIMFLMFLLLIVFMGGFLIFLNFQYSAFEKETNDEQARIIQTETVKTIQKRVKEINDDLSALKKIYDTKSDIYDNLNAINEEIFYGVRIYGLDIDSASGLITVSGNASLREDLVAIRNVLKNNSHYKEVDFPLSNLANPKNINFRFSFTYSP